MPGTSSPVPAAAASSAGPAKGHGKRGGARVIYYWVTDDERILLLDIYAKNEAENLSAARLQQLKRKIP